MIRVALSALGGAGWTGGVRYLWNLLYAVGSQLDRRVHPVVLCGDRDQMSEARSLPNVEVFADPALKLPTLRQVGKLCRVAFGRDPVQEGVVRRARALVFSHSPLLGPRARVPWIFWIPDLQHRRLPHLFVPREVEQREHQFRQALRDASRVVVSSMAALEDLRQAYGFSACERCRVLRFVAQPGPPSTAVKADELIAERNIPVRFIHLPNQFWRHKNHAVVVEALALAVRARPDLVVIATGAPIDHRNPSHYPKLMARVRDLKLQNNFRHIGLVPFPEMTALMRRSLAVLNPSSFEGWSTTVEEAKSMGKKLLLSDIPVHREQAPDRATYFPLDDPGPLADALLRVWSTHKEEEERIAAIRAERELPARTATFAQAYEEIVIEALDSPRVTRRA